ncbi:hypothetical protein GCM10022280_11430 [Sphingomonas swuensis]|uniref:TonB C-terminal domain-containing protein n=1 Tax=Sphingomonas swuensis TaxID=977800 RepID=A0ABP7SPQ1_9SPHN
MNDRKVACIAAALFLGTVLTAGATDSLAAPRPDIVVKAPQIDPELQRTVSYADLNLALKQDQRRFDWRIHRTANSLCFDINGYDNDLCTRSAIESTDDQVAAAIDRAKRKMAGLPVGPAIAISMVIGN